MDRGALEALRDETLAKLGSVDILLNAAGKTKRRPTIDVPIEEWRDIMDTNVTGMVIACQVFYAASKASKHGGRVINIASLSSYVSLNEVAAYAASKSAVLSLTKSLAIEWSKEGINVNAIAPGVFRTDLNAGLLDGTDRGREFLLRTPMKRFGKPEELVGAAVLSASGSASFITGQCIAVDGGFLCSGVNS
jgi:NAD(P)-dependent dehydrogenase (short-subunit alcohol dehydrogenase family)